MNLPRFFSSGKKTRARKPSKRRKPKGSQQPWLPWVLGVVVVLVMAGVGLLKWSESRTGQAALLAMGSQKMFDEVQLAVDQTLAQVFPNYDSGPLGPDPDPWNHDWPAPELGNGARIFCRAVAVDPEIPYREIQLQLSEALEQVGGQILWAQRQYPARPGADQVQPSEERDHLRLDIGVTRKPTHTLLLYRQGQHPELRWGQGPGVSAWASLAAQADAPLVALVIDDWGYAKTEATRQLQKLPVPLTMAVLPGLSYSREFALAKTDLVLPPQALHSAAAARQTSAAGRIERLAAGCFVELSTDRQSRRLENRRREILLHLPMEPERYPEADPGPQAIMVGMGEDEILARLDRALGQLDRVTGVNNHMGSAATSDAATMALLMEALDDRGLLFLDSLTSSRSVAFEAAVARGIPALRNRLFLDYDNEDEQKITAKLNRLVEAARSTGYAVGIGHPHPATARVLAREIPRLVAEGVVFVTVSELHALKNNRQKALQ